MIQVTRAIGQRAWHKPGYQQQWNVCLTAQTKRSDMRSVRVICYTKKPKNINFLTWIENRAHIPTYAISRDIHNVEIERAHLESLQPVPILPTSQTREVRG